VYPPAVEAHFEKYRSLFASLALIFEVVCHVSGSDPNRPKGKVSEASARIAYAMCKYLQTHAMRLYHPALTASTIAASNLLEHLEAGDIDDGTPTRTIWKRGWHGLSSAQELDAAIEVLEEHGWVRREEVRNKKGGRPSEVLRLHPMLRGE